MKLRDLEARLLNKENTWVESVGDACAILFLCPVCFHKTGHSIKVYFANRGVDPGRKPFPRWKASGNTIDDLTLEPSIWINKDLPLEIKDACRWHGWIKKGEAS